MDSGFGVGVLRVTYNHNKDRSPPRVGFLPYRPSRYTLLPLPPCSLAPRPDLCRFHSQKPLCPLAAGRVQPMGKNQNTCLCSFTMMSPGVDHVCERSFLFSREPDLLASILLDSLGNRFSLASLEAYSNHSRDPASLKSCNLPVAPLSHPYLCNLALHKSNPLPLEVSTFECFIFFCLEYQTDTTPCSLDN